MKQTISIDTPLSEMTLRRYEKPYDLTRRNLVRKLCLSVGLLQPGDSRDVVVDVLFVLLQAKVENKHLTSEEVNKKVIDIRTAEKMPLVGIAGSNIRRQLKRLREVHLAEKVKNTYRITEFAKIKDTFEDKMIKYMLPSIIERVREYYDKVDGAFSLE
ncbi:hypothetical protein GOV08_05660 [Candidatus Woesearchaeota archaeon]|nr:hypothetical protein [Candidatus Woesearchaeota archaeon]